MEEGWIDVFCCLGQKGDCSATVLPLASMQMARLRLLMLLDPVMLGCLNLRCWYLEYLCYWEVIKGWEKLYGGSEVSGYQGVIAILWSD